MVSTLLRDENLVGLCDALAGVDPQAPTLCDGWDAHDAGQPGAPATRVHGLPSEVILWIYGRDEVADVTVTPLY